MKKILLLSTLIVFIFTGCSKPKETDTNANVVTNEDHAIQDISEEDAKVDPELITPTYDDAIKSNDETETIEGTFGGSPVIWHTIKIDDVEYYYVETEAIEGNRSSEINQTPASFAIVGSNYTLKSGIEVGMRSDEVLSKYPDLVRTEFNEKYNDSNTNNACLDWNGAAYPEKWKSQYDYGLMANVDNGIDDDLPKYLVLLSKDEKVVAITFMYPTAS
ncbi:hypothetical protein [Anaerosporobacter sp.]